MDPETRATFAAMNEQLRSASLPAATQAAEGLPRRRWTVVEIEAMVANGIILEDECLELIKAPSLAVTLGTLDLG